MAGLIPGDVIEKRCELAFFTYGRMNPPTVGHKALIDQVIRESMGAGAGGARQRADAYVFPTSTHDRPDNPLPVEKKVDILKRMFPGDEVRIINTSDCRVSVGGSVSGGECRTAGDVVGKLRGAGYLPENITLLVGEVERIDSFKFLKDAERGGMVYKGINVRTIAEPRVKGAAGAAGMSGTNMRMAAEGVVAGNERSLTHMRAGINRHIPDDALGSLAKDIVRGMTNASLKKSKAKSGGGKNLSRQRRGKPVCGRRQTMKSGCARARTL